jgi:holo-[acyl-carrier protein] synthase
MPLSIRCGTDLIAVRRVAQAVGRLGQPFLDRIWTTSEQAESLPDGLRTDAGWASLAARFAAKEAVVKALGTGIGSSGIHWTDVVVSRPSGLAPSIQLQGAACDCFRSLGGQSIAVSLAHDAGLAQAFCVILLDPETAGKPENENPAREGPEHGI